MRLVAAAFLLIIVNPAHGQSNAIFNYQIGTEIHREHYNRRAKLEFRLVEKILRCDTTSEGLFHVMNITKYSRDGKELFKSDDSLKCINGVVMIDMQSIYRMKDNAAYKWNIESEHLSIPGVMTDGQTLPDASVVCAVIKEPRLKIAPAGSVVKSDKGAKVIYAIKNRRVMRDTITTPMGEFASYKVTSDVINESELGYGYKIKFVTHEWYAEGVGLVGSELWNDSGKLLSSMAMTKRIR